ncbi:hypothetical protein [Paracoccus laeviglucosivorans]|uniref:Short chain dehydrogenase n=1 Tax=Paracoccus laeviglucosivorans TaxID=1197861 RepID=A0A521EF71_9RHOB|nr:hypothetical protein [Paracoccus laeviglucosivorans]SMO82131.1 hypothetical protein SAMN06265221_112106 [Paracoccus laeviglucosivorans]
MDMGLKDKVVIVTGGGSGIGAGITEVLECDQEDFLRGDDRTFIRRDALPKGVGIGTLADLQRLGLIVCGVSRWRQKEGFRITQAGRDAIGGSGHPQ